MQRTPHRCPHCEQPLHLHADMWGLYYLCADCGWTAEDDEHLKLNTGSVQRVSKHVLTVGESHRAWESRRLTR